MSDPTKTQEAPTVEIVTGESTALQVARPVELEVIPALGPLAFQADAVAVIERMGKTLQALQEALIRTTQPEDWIVQGTGVALLGNAGCNRCAPLLGLSIEPLPGQDLAPKRLERENGAVEYTIAAWAYSKTLARGEEIEVTRSSKEQFLGRQTNSSGDIVRKDGTAPHDPDHRNATRSLLLSKAVRKLGGLGNVPEVRLLEIFGPGAKGRFQRGHGGGSAKDRASEAVAEGDVRQKAKELGDELLRWKSGDAEAAAAALVAVTEDKDGNFGKTSIRQFTQGWQVDNAWKALRARKDYQAYKSGGTSASGASRGRREPGQDEGTEP